MAALKYHCALILWVLIALVPGLYPTKSAEAADIAVGTLRSHKTLAAGVAAARAGDRILLDPGIYLNDTATINTALTIEGVGPGVILRTTEAIPNRKGILVINADLVVRKITFDGAQVSKADGANGAGIRHQAGTVTVENCAFSNNQNGILTNSGASARLIIKGTTFTANGGGDGYTHAVYANVIASLTISDSTFAGTRVGHDVKSRALKTTITNTVLDDGVTGTPSYAVDLPNGGEVILDGLRVVQGPKTSNTTMLAYGAEGSLHPNSSLSLSNSTLISQTTNSTGLYNFTNIAAKLSNNTFQNVSQQIVNNKRAGVATDMTAAHTLSSD